MTSPIEKQMAMDLCIEPNLVGQNWERQLASIGVKYWSGWPDEFGTAIESWSRQEVSERIPTLSLFSGAGGLDIGFAQAGFDIKEAVEIDKRFSDSLTANSAGAGVLEGTKISTQDIRTWAPSKDEKIDFIIGGPPCQTFSAAGRRAGGVSGTTDERGQLFNEYVRILRVIQPRGFLFENVYGITGAEDGEPWKDIQQAFKSAGYNIFHRILDAADYGVPQHRERLFIVGLREGEYFFPKPTHGPDSHTGLNFFTAKEAIKGCIEHQPDSSLNITGEYGYLFDDIPPGLNYSFYTKRMGHPKPIFSWRSKFSDFLYKADPEKPVRTIKAQGGAYTGPFHWENRRFTINELKRLQTFPDKYILNGGRNLQIHQIGNSVPPQLARVLALSVLKQVFGIQPPIAIRLLNHNETLGFRKRKHKRTTEYLEIANNAIKANGFGHNPIKPTTESYWGKLSNRFDWSVGHSGDGVFDVKVSCDEEWQFVISKHRPSNHQLTIDICESQGMNWDLGFKRVVIQGKSITKDVYVAAWKAFEHELSVRELKADLVQLCGYYQYPRALSANLTFDDGFLPNKRWRVLQFVVKGIGVGKLVSQQDLLELWGVTNAELRSTVLFLRSLGYEVRNNNTNSQIETGFYLIPYVFPTLTSKSVQLTKEV